MVLGAQRTANRSARLVLDQYELESATTSVPRRFTIHVSLICQTSDGGWLPDEQINKADGVSVWHPLIRRVMLFWRIAGNRSNTDEDCFPICSEECFFAAGRRRRTPHSLRKEGSVKSKHYHARASDVAIDSREVSVPVRSGGCFFLWSWPRRCAQQRHRRASTDFDLSCIGLILCLTL